VTGIDILALARALVDIDSTTGREGEVGSFLVEYLGALGFSVSTQQVDGLSLIHKYEPTRPKENSYCVLWL
jgi:acetylornithine deacetylase/succinyl-diaminopimelate desuccinylase-like protein